MLPILISVSEAPTSYFFCASAGLALTAVMAAKTNRGSDFFIEGIEVSLDRFSSFFGLFNQLLYDVRSCFALQVGRN
jgi:hypothetical protein